jgi:hypothetical protein
MGQPPWASSSPCHERLLLPITVQRFATLQQELFRQRNVRDHDRSPCNAPFTVLHWPHPPRECSYSRGTQQVPALAEHLGIALAQLLEQEGGPLDVSEEQSHGAAWQVTYGGCPLPGFG